VAVRVKGHPPSPVQILRTAQGLRQTELAARAGIGLNTVRRLEAETGYRPRTAHTRRALADALGVPEEVLFPPKEER
jgi:transcriptional regulator with XRE-family HTH domain